MIDRHAIIVVTGAQAAGKTTVGRLLASRFARGAFVEADALQRMIVSGLAWVTDVNDAPVRPTGEAMAQLRLRLHNACLLTRSFYEAGFNAVLTTSSSASASITSARAWPACPSTSSSSPPASPQSRRGTPLATRLSAAAGRTTSTAGCAPLCPASASGSTLLI
jgi:hypothetical protein